jgi:rhodanese-related sulfurtransferase
MAEAGYRACHNVAGGFEAGGWKATGLPWIQG